MESYEVEIYWDDADPANPGWAYRVRDKDVIGQEESGPCDSIGDGADTAFDILRAWGVPQEKAMSLISKAVDAANKARIETRS